MKKLLMIFAILSTLAAGCAVDATATERPGPDPCAPFWDTPEAYCGDSDTGYQFCFFDDGRAWAHYPDGTRILFARWTEERGAEGIMCYVRSDGQIVSRQSREQALASVGR